MDEFKSDHHYIYYCGQEALRRKGVAIIVNKRVWNAVLGCNLKKNRVISAHFHGKTFNITVIQVYALTRNAEEAEIECFYEELQVLLKLTPKKRFPFHYRELECKSRKSRNIWNNRQIWPWSTEWIKVTANRVLQENALVIANTLFQHHQRRLYTWTSPDGQHQYHWLYSLQPKMEKLYTVIKNMTRSWPWLRSWTLYCKIQT